MSAIRAVAVSRVGDPKLGFMPKYKAGLESSTNDVAIELVPRNPRSATSSLAFIVAYRARRAPLNAAHSVTDFLLELDFHESTLGKRTSTVIRPPIKRLLQ